jgi:hypothetical protein
MGRSKSKREEIEERRQKILQLQSMGYSQYAIIKQLGITRMTMLRDMRSINESTKKGLFGVAKNETLSTYFYNCLQGVNDVQKECWKIYKNEDNNPEINHPHRMKALDLLRKSAQTKFEMFQNVPAYMEIERLRKEIKYIKEKTFDERGQLTDEELEDLDKP